MSYLNIEYLDGAKESHFCGRNTIIQVEDGILEQYHGDGSYRERGLVKAWPIHNIRKWWTSEDAVTEAGI